MVRIAAGESDAWSWLVRGCAVRSCLVFVLYPSRAFLKMTLKLEEDAMVAGILELD